MGKLETAITGWENSLLDLGKRNRMINYPISQGKRRSLQTLRLEEPGYQEIYDLLVRQGKSLTVQQPPVEKFDLRCEGVMRLFERLGRPVVPMQGVLRPQGSFTEYRKVLGNMRSKMKLAREEQGIGILYLAVGFLDWKQLTGKMEELTSPLLLVPVRLKMKSIRAPYVLEMLDEDVVVNPALGQLFQMEYGLTLPELPRQDAPVDEFLDQVAELAKKHSWAVRRECHLALMSFQKISMYHDLRRSHDRIAQSAVLRAIAGEEAYPMDASVMDNVSLDGIPPEESHLVVDADSSQHYAIELSRRGVSFCLQGPPGGGKSQTITNIIAQALADGKKVLFVAEKMAALDVVHRRLRDAGLGEFTLALHSHRADRKSILAELGAPLQLARQQLDHTAMATLDELEDLRSSLNIYPILLHRRRAPLDDSLYTVLGELAELQGLPLIMAELSGVEKVTRSDLNAETVRLSRLARAHERYCAFPNNPYEGLQGAWTTFMARTQLRNEITSALEAAQQLQPHIAALLAQDLLRPGAELTGLPALVGVVQTAAQGPVSDAWFEAAAPLAALARQARDAALQHEKARAAMEVVFLPGAQVNAAALTRMTALDSDLRAVLAGTDWQKRTDAYATHYATLASMLPPVADAAEQALRLLGCRERTGREADWALDAAAAIVRAPAMNSIPDTDAQEPLLGAIRSIREQAAALMERQAQLLGRIWAPSVLSLDAAGLLRRFASDYSGFSRMLNMARYNQDMQRIHSHYRGPSRLDETSIRAFLSRLDAWRRDHEAWSRQAYTLTMKLEMPTMGIDGDWAGLENQLQSMAALSACAKDPAHSALLLAALKRPDIRQKAAAIPATLRYEAFDRSLSSAAFAGNALEDDISVTLRSVMTAAEDLASLRALQDELRPACRENATYAAMLEGLRAADEAERSGRLLTEALAGLESVDPAACAAARADAAALCTHAEAVAEAAGKAALLPEGLARRLLTGAQTLPEMAAIPGFGAAVQRLSDLSGRFDPAASPLAQPFEALCARLQRCLDEPDALDLWQEWRDVLADMQNTLFAPFVPAAISAGLPAAQWADAARRLFLYSWVEHVLGTEHLLSVFRAHVHEESIARFGDLDRQQLHIARSRIRKQLIDVVPDEKHRALSATDELALLLSEMNRKSGHMPLRKLFSRIPNLLTTLKPCLMMSPLSVASYLENSALTFDLVIFDEASQIMPENAVGAIMRGKQVIVTGDTKQMPPTDFFTVSVGAHDYDAEEDEEQEEVVSAQESILEQCASVLPSCPLLWHYRSRHESLIAFSNREIYSGRLVTFPGSISRQPHLGVELVYVPDGVFTRRRNRQEAKRCIRLIEEHILERSHRSLGVVAFSRTQQSAIEEELHRFRIAHPEYDEFFDEHRDEPFFIKNLENVQGDERDTMIFSVGYAKREGGKPMLLNLGPLSAAGGERRLNVAITRARYNVKLVTSVLARDIDLGRTTSEGTRLLRAYIDYAENGYAAIDGDGAVLSAAAPQTDAFVSHLASVLEAEGFRVERSVGCSDCRVDLAVCHPTQEGRYVLGVLTDGSSYARQHTCRDRDRLQGSVLQGMGWRLHRVWSADWLQRPDGVERDLIAAARSAVENPDPTPGISNAQPPRDWSRPADPDDEPVPVAFADYQTTRLPDGQTLPVNELVLRVVDTEQPVHRDELCRRLAPALGHDRVDPSLRREVEVAVARLMLDDLREEDGFLTRAGFALTLPRRAGHRSIDMISPQELQLAIRLVAKHSIRAAREDIIVHVAGLLGFERRGPRIQKALESAFDSLVAMGALRITDGKAEALPDMPALPAPEAEAPALPAASDPIALPAPHSPDQEVTEDD